MAKFVKKPTPTVAIAKGTDPYGTTKKAIDLLGGIRKFVDPGDVVWIKPNWNSQAVNEDALLAGGTDPRVTAALVKLCLEEGKAKKVIIAELMGAGATSATCYAWKFKGKALTDYPREAGAEIVELDKYPYKIYDIPKGKVLKRAKLPKLIEDVNVYINNPKVKTHLAATMTLGIKNHQGLFLSEEKMEFHRTDVTQKLVDVLWVAYPDLTVIEGLTAGEKQCPHNPSLRKNTNVITASPDIVAVDAVTSKIFGVEPREVSMIRVAANDGFGEMDLDKITIVGNKIEEVYCPLKRAFMGISGYYTFADCIEGATCLGCYAWIQSAFDCWIEYDEYKDILEALKEKGVRPTFIVGLEPWITMEEVEERAKKGPVLVFGDCPPRWLKEHKDVFHIKGCPPWDAMWLPGGVVDAFKKYGVDVRIF